MCDNARNPIKTYSHQVTKTQNCFQLILILCLRDFVVGMYYLYRENLILCAKILAPPFHLGDACSRVGPPRSPIGLKRLLLLEELMATRDFIVIGASAGGVQALVELVGALPPNIPAA